MAITINDNFLNNSPKSFDGRRLKNGLNPYTSLQDVYDNYPQAYRARGAVVDILEEGYLIQYWWKNGVTNNDLVRKTDENPQKLITTGTVTLGDNDEHVLVNAISNVTINLPSAGGRYGKRHRITRIDDANYVVNVVPNIQEKINNQAVLSIPAKYLSYEIEAANLGIAQAPSPGWVIINSAEPLLEEEAFTPLLKFNKDKVRYQTLSETITYSVSPTGNRYGKVITDHIQASDDFIVNIPEDFMTSGRYKKGVKNTISMTILPQTSSDLILATIRQEDTFVVPAVYDVHIMGLPAIQGNMLMTMYSYNPNTIEGDSIINWYKADNASGLNSSQIVGQNGEGIELTNDLCQKYLRVGIIPVNNLGDVGVEAFSSWEGPVTGCTTSQTTTMAGSFNPSVVSGLQIWLGDQKVSTGGAVTQWTDKSGNGNHFLPENTSRRPALANGLNGIQGVQFNGSQNLRGPALSNTDSYTVFTVGTIGACRGLDGSGNGWSIVMFGAGKVNIAMTSTTTEGYENPYVFNLATAKLATVVINNSGTNNSSLTVYDAGIQRNTLPIANRQLRSSSVGWTLGQGGGANGFDSGNIQEVVIYNRVLTGAEITNVNNFLKQKYNIA